jgi:hypothetical protein
MQSTSSNYCNQTTRIELAHINQCLAAIQRQKV